MEDVKITLRLPADVHQQVMAIAQRETRSLNSQIVHFLRRQLEQEHKPSRH